MVWWEAFFGDVAEFLGGFGLEVPVIVIRIVALAVGVWVTYHVVRWVVGVADDVVGFVRTQIRERAWQDPGRLGLFVSLLLLVLAYGLFPGEQVDPADQASRVVADLAGTVAPAAILTQAVILGVSWLVLASLSGVRGRHLAGPFVSVLVGTLFFSLMFVVSVVPFVLTDGDARVLGDLTLWVVGGVFLGFPLLLGLILRVTKERPSRSRDIVLGIVAMVALTMICALPTAWGYAANASDPSVAGLLATTLRIASFVFLFVCFSFQLSMDVHIEQTGAPRVVGHLVNLCAAVTAAAIALTGHPALEVVLGTVPAIVVGMLPGLAVAAMIVIVHLRKAEPTPRLRTSMAAAVALGLLVIPLRDLLLATDVAAFLPLG